MKLYFICEDTKKLIGEPQNEEELAQMVFDDGKKKFVIFKGKLKFSFTAGTEFVINQSSLGNGKYLLEN